MKLGWTDVELWIQLKEQEGLQLDFKRGDALGLEEKQRAELVKDATGFANGGGGRLVYGISEELVDDIGCAAGIAPVQNAKVSKEWITQILRDKVSPPLSAFDVYEIPVPLEKGGGRIVVVDVAQAGTAHQSLYDHKYHLRAGATTKPMVDFQIRDVMNRQLGPVLDVELEKHNSKIEADEHSYYFIPILKNSGKLALEKWLFQVDIPAEIVRDDVFVSAGVSHFVSLETVRVEGRSVVRIGFADPAWRNQSALLYPGRTLLLDASLGYPMLQVVVTDAVWRRIRRSKLPIDWRVYLTNSKPIEGQIAFEDWCIY